MQWHAIKEIVFTKEQIFGRQQIEIFEKNRQTLINDVIEMQKFCCKYVANYIRSRESNYHTKL